jgi:hypothetical protein
MQTILNNFRITEDEYQELERKFGRLAHKQAWDLKRKNVKNNCPEDQEDIVQDIRIALLRAGSYYKRQTYILSSFEALEEHVKDPFMSKLINELKGLWKKRTRHGAGKQKFGPFQEAILERLLRRYIPKNARPQRDRPLIFDKRFAIYCKRITWNEQRHAGKKITREKSWRSGMASLSEYDFLVGQWN